MPQTDFPSCSTNMKQRREDGTTSDKRMEEQLTISVAETGQERTQPVVLTG
jgi:hypothetical protein